jgi:glutathione S-transferase
MEEEITLYQFPESGNCYKIRLCLNWLGKKYKVINLSRDENLRKTKDFLSISPLGKVPVLCINDLVLTESMSILFYLYKRYGIVSKEKLVENLIQNLIEEAEMLKWLSFEQSEIQNNIGRLRYITRFLNDSEGENLYGEIEKYKVDELMSNAKSALQVVENHLQNRDFILKEFSICDIALFSYVHLVGEIGINLDSYRNISRWIKNVKNTKNFKRIYE